MTQCHFQLGVQRPLPPAKKAHQNLRVRCLQLHQILPTYPHGRMQDRSSTTGQRAWDESCPPVHLVISRQTSVWAVKPKEAAEPTISPLSHGLGKPVLEQKPMERGDFSMLLKQQQQRSLDALETERGTLPVLSLPQGNTALLNQQ